MTNDRFDGKFGVDQTLPVAGREAVSYLIIERRKERRVRIGDRDDARATEVIRGIPGRVDPDEIAVDAERNRFARRESVPEIQGQNSHVGREGGRHTHAPRVLSDGKWKTEIGARIENERGVSQVDRELLQRRAIRVVPVQREERRIGRALVAVIAGCAQGERRIRRADQRLREIRIEVVWERGLFQLVANLLRRKR